MSEHPRVLLVDDNDRLRGLYRIALETLSDMRIVGEAADGEQGIHATRALKPDIVLLDLSMPRMDGLEALGEIRRASPASHVVVLTGFKADRLQDVALELGASAFLEKGIPPSQLADALRLATSGAPPPLPAVAPDRREELERRVRDLV